MKHPEKLITASLLFQINQKLDFVQMNKNLLEFLLAIFVNIVKLSPDDVEAVADIFTDSKKKLANEEIKAMYLGLKFFVQQFIMKKPRFMEKHQKYRGHFEAIQFALRWLLIIRGMRSNLNFCNGNRPEIFYIYIVRQITSEKLLMV